MSDYIEFPKWNNAKPSESLKQVYEWTVSQAQQQIAWYGRKKGPKRVGSRLFRGLAAPWKCRPAVVA